MCGIVGIYDLQSHHRIEVELLLRMRNKLSHRGPDDATFFIDPNIGLAFTRLNVVGGDQGRQPIWNAAKSCVLICNGEIYNYKELRQYLMDYGYHFSTQSDCEVILHLYDKEGINFLNKLNGQFAFVIYDTQKRCLFGARDQFGIAPFFYTVTRNGFFLFASEIKALLCHPAVRKEVDLIGLDQVFTFPGLVSPRTLFKSIASLPNGHYLQLAKNDTQVKTAEYWDLVYPKLTDINPQISEDEVLAQVNNLFTQSMTSRMQADAKLGYYLSGGLDSALITTKATFSQRHPVTSFSINVDDPHLSEGKYQRFLANFLGSDHHEYFFQSSDILNRVKQAIYHSECPLKETYNTASLALSELARSKGVKVILTGEGADELFGGYIGYRFDQMNSSNNKIVFNDSESILQQKLWANPNFIYEKNYAEFQGVKRKLYAENLYDKSFEIEATNHLVINPDRVKDLHITHLRSYLDYKLRLCDHLLSDHGDRMGYANGIECRYPFLDINLVEFVTTIPPHWLVHNYEEKYLLKKLASSILPSKIVSREKFGFVTPASSVLLKLNDDYINDILSYDRIAREGYFNPKEVQNLKVKYSSPDFRLNVPFETDLLIIVISFGIFLELFNMPSL